MAPRDLAPAWYIFIYHDVSWEDGPFIRHIGGTCPPDIFRAHLADARSIATVVSIQDGYNRLTSGRIESPLISFWFDDGLAGVKKYAAPILAEHGLTGAVSICPRFCDGTEMFWRFKLSYIHATDAGRQLRSRLRPLGYRMEHLTRDFTLDHFNMEVLSAVDEVYQACTSELFRRDAFRLFMKPHDVTALQAAGWEIANHSAAHYPIGERNTLDLVAPQFTQAEDALNGWLSRPTRFWVFPFSRDISSDAVDRVIAHGRVPVLVGEKPNVGTDQSLFRIGPSTTSRSGLIDAIKRAQGAPGA